MIIINRSSSYLLGPNEPERADEGPRFYLGQPHRAHSAEYLQEMREGMIETACAFAKTRPVYMVRPFPELKLNVPKTMGHRLLLGEEERISISLEEYHQRHAFVWETQDLAAQRCGVKILDPLPYLCIEGHCRGDRDGLPIYYDDDHLNERGGSLLVAMFRQVFDSNLALSR